MGNCGRAKQWPRRSAEGQESKPHIAVIDIGMPLLNGLETARRMLKCKFTTKSIDFDDARI
jgi:DNA-binding response OmpR family regulator